MPQINDNSGKNQDGGRTYAYRGDKNPHKPLILLGNDVFQVPVACGESFAHLLDAICVLYRAFVEFIKRMIKIVQALRHLHIDVRRGG